MSLRSKFLAVLMLVLVGGAGTTGGFLIVSHSRHDHRMLDEKQRLVVEHAAFTLKENLSVAAREVVRLSKLPQIDPADNDVGPERQLLYSAHHESVLFSAVSVLDVDGRLMLVQPEGHGRVGQSFADRHWFAAARKADQPFFYTMPEKGGPTESLAIIVPLRAGGRFGGAIQGIMDLASDNVLTPELAHAAGPSADGGEFAVVDPVQQRVLFPADARVPDPWAPVFADLARGGTGTRHAGEWLYAYAPVGIGTWGVAMRWPWATLHREERAEIETTVALFVVGMLAVAAIGIAFAAYLTRPLVELGAVAARIARGEPGGASPTPRADEIGTLYGAFAHMESELASRDRKIREDFETITRLNASLEERVRERTRELVETQARLVDSERFAAMGKTAAAIAHELRNALNGLGMCVDLVLADAPSPSPSPSMVRVRAQLRSEIARLRDITENLLTFSRTPRLDVAPADLNVLVGRALEVLAEQIADAGVAVQQALADGPLLAECDGYKVQGVLINLVKNGVEAMATRPLDVAGTGLPAAEREKHLVVATRSDGDDAIVVEVSDTGPGLSDDNKRRLFEPFYTTKVTGTGLGLATARRVIEAHGGKITVEDAPGGGAKFVVRLPRHAVRAQIAA